MTTLIHADVFFFVTAVYIIIFTTFVVVATLYIISILNDIKHISKRLRTESDEVLEDIKVLREHIREEGFKVGMITKLFGKFFKKRKK